MSLLAAWLALQLLHPSSLPEAARLVVRADRTVHAIDEAGETHLAPGEAIWQWSRGTPPRRLAGSGTVVDPSERRDWLTIRTLVHEDRASDERLALIAAPVAMWREVPEALLPRWPVLGRLVRVPVSSSEPWRLRLVGRRLGGQWKEARPSEAVIDLVPELATEMVLRVESGLEEAIDRAEIVVREASRSRGEDGALARFVAEPDGTVRMPAVPLGVPMTLWVRAAGHAPAVVRGRPVDLPTIVRLEPGAAMRGRFVDAAGMPVSGVSLFLESWLPGRAGVFLRRLVKSGPRGEWRITELPRARFALNAIAEGFAPAFRSVSLDADEVDVGDVRLVEAVALRLKVVDDRGLPIAGADLDSGLGLRARTDNDGWAEIHAAGDVELTLDVEASGHLGKSARIQPPLPAETTVELSRSVVVSGRLVDATGMPVTSGTLRLRTGNSSSDGELLPDGRFEVDLTPHREGKLTLQSPRTREVTISIAAGQPGERVDLGDVEADSGTVVTGTVVGGDEYLPVPNARVWVLRPDERGPAMAWMHRSFIETTTSADGSFVLTGLPALPVSLRIDASGYARRSIALDPSTDTLAIELGIIELASGATLRVMFEAPAADGAVARLDLGQDGLGLDMVTAPVSRGLVVMRHLPEGPATLAVAKGRRSLCWRELEIPADAEELEVECLPGSMLVRGVVTTAGVPAGPGYLVWDPPAPRTWAGILHRVSPGGARQDEVFGGGRPEVVVEVAPSGSFQTEELTPGPWSVAWRTEEGSVYRPLLLTLPEAEEVELPLEFGGALVRGRVLDTRREAVAGARVRELTTGVVSFSQSDGSFSFGGLPLGLRRFRARHGRLVSAVAELELEADAEPPPLELELRDVDPERIAIRVLHESGGPLAGALVFVQSEQGLRILTSDSAGVATASFQGGLPERLRAAAWGDGSWALGGYVARSAFADGLLLEADRGGQLLIRSDGPAGELRVDGPAGWDLGLLLRRLGHRLAVTPESPLLVSSVPPGDLQVHLGGQVRGVSVRPGRSSEIGF